MRASAHHHGSILNIHLTQPATNNDCCIPRLVASYEQQHKCQRRFVLLQVVKSCPTIGVLPQVQTVWILVHGDYLYS